MNDDGPDVYFKQRIPFEFEGERFAFDVSQMLFSSHRIDAGTAMLLRTRTPGRVYFDAIQLERGLEPTAFEP